MTTATKSNANAAHPIAVAFLPAKTGSGPTCKHAITVISLLTLPIRLRRAFTEKRALGSNAGPRGRTPLFFPVGDAGMAQEIGVSSCRVQVKPCSRAQSKERRNDRQIYL